MVRSCAPAPATAANYQPIVSPLAADSRPTASCASSDLAPFSTAPTSAIRCDRPARAIIARRSGVSPRRRHRSRSGSSGGFHRPHRRRSRSWRPGIVPVFGSETLAGAAALAAILAALGPNGFVLRRLRGARCSAGGGRAACRAVAEPPHPDDPRSRRDRRWTDIAALRRLRERAAPRAVFAAGGVRGEADIVALAESGVAGALVATALQEDDFPPRRWRGAARKRGAGSIAQRRQARRRAVRLPSDRRRSGIEARGLEIAVASRRSGNARWDRSAGAG